jgi:hypothetical protein
MVFVVRTRRVIGCAADRGRVGARIGLRSQVYKKSEVAGMGGGAGARLSALSRASGIGDR